MLTNITKTKATKYLNKPHFNKKNKKRNKLIFAYYIFKSYSF